MCGRKQSASFGCADFVRDFSTVNAAATPWNIVREEGIQVDLLHLTPKTISIS